MNEFISLLEVIVTSKAAVAVVALSWVFFTYKTCSEERRAHTEERKEWAKRVDALADALHESVMAFERKS